MKDKIAERLLAGVMGWGREDVARERPDIQALATYRYDDYQRFSPGMKFVESLASWLKQFQTLEEKRVAYDFVRHRIVFVSLAEMAHLVSMAYPSVITQVLVAEVAKRKGIPDWYLRKIVSSKEFRVLLRQSLFLGLSDGSHTDIFRRNNPHISHEQVLRTHEISHPRAQDMLESLTGDLKGILGREPTKEESRFRLIFLLDDFSGSGLSYIRPGDVYSGYGGKIASFYRDLQATGGELSGLVEHSELRVILVLYLATSQAYDHLERMGTKLFGGVPFNVKTVHLLNDSIKVNEAKDGPFLELLRKYYDNSIEDKSYLKGRHEKPYLGFDECSLPLVLAHNAPNNSVTLLWFYEDCKYRGLFPRVSRFRDPA